MYDILGVVAEVIILTVCIVCIASLIRNHCK